MELSYYITESGKNPFVDWLTALRDKRIAARIEARINRLGDGNFGDCKFIREGVSELRIDMGPGYRVYYATSGRDCMLLLCGGDKRRQSADIQQAVRYWRDYKKRTKQP